MTNFAAALKSELSRVSRKEVRTESVGLKKVVTTLRTDISALKKRLAELEKSLKATSKAVKRAAPALPTEEPDRAFRFSAKGLASQRTRLGLSVGECALLVGVSGQSISNWEEGKARPRPSALAAIASLRKMGKKDAAAKLEQLRGSA